MYKLIAVINGGVFEYNAPMQDDNRVDALNLALSKLPADYSYAEIRDQYGDLEFQSVNLESFAEIE